MPYHPTEASEGFAQACLVATIVVPREECFELRNQYYSTADVARLGEFFDALYMCSVLMLILWAYLICNQLLALYLTQV